MTIQRIFLSLACGMFFSILLVQNIASAAQMPEADKINFRYDGGLYSTYADCTPVETNQEDTTDEISVTNLSATDTTAQPTANQIQESGANNIDYKGRQILSPDQLAKITTNRPIYEKAGATARIPWQMIAAIHVRESGLSMTNPRNGQGIFQDYGYTHNMGKPYTPGPVSDDEFIRQAVNAAKDLVNGTRETLRAGLASGNPDSVKDSFFAYNGRADVYIGQAIRLGFSKEQGYEGSPYVMNKYDAKREPSSTWGQIKTDHGRVSYPANQDYGAFVVYQSLGGAGGLSNSACPQYGATDGGLGSADGVTFPLKTTQGVIKKGVNGAVWCYTKTTYCHHDYKAADIFAPEGTQVVAAKGGTISSAVSSGSGARGGARASVTIKDDQGVIWFYTHGTPNSLATPFRRGEAVAAGQPLMTVGPSSAADGTTPHLHIDALPESAAKNGMFRPSCAGASCKAYPFIEIQPPLIKAFLALPSGRDYTL